MRQAPIPLRAAQDRIDSKRRCRLRLKTHRALRQQRPRDQPRQSIAESAAQKATSSANARIANSSPSARNAMARAGHSAMRAKQHMTASSPLPARSTDWPESMTKIGSTFRLVNINHHLLQVQTARLSGSMRYKKNSRQGASLRNQAVKVHHRTLRLRKRSHNQP